MVWGDWVYYVQSNYTALKRVRTDGAVVETLVEVSDKREITGFIRQGDRLFYSVVWLDPFGVVQFEYWAYTPATGQDERLPVSGNFNLMCIPAVSYTHLHQAGHLRRARRRSLLRGVLPQHWAELCVLLPLPRADRP